MRRTYEPGRANVAVVAADDGSAKVTGPGPPTFVHVVVTVAPAGRPSSVTVAASAARFWGSVIVWSAPASTSGAALAGTTVTVTSSVAVRSPSLAVRRSTWIPATAKVALVLAAAGSPKTTGPGPLTAVQPTLSPPPCGSPS